AAASDSERSDRLPQLGRVVDTHRTRGAGGVAGLDHYRKADALDEGADLLGIAGADRLRAGNARRAQSLLHRRLVAAEEGRLDAGAGNPAGLAHARGAHHVRLDHRFQAIDSNLGLHEAHRALDLRDVGDVADLLVVEEPM